MTTAFSTTAFLLYDLRRSVTVLALSAAIVTSCVLFLSGPLQAGSPNWFQLVGVFAGLLLAGRLMSDPGGTQSYVCSRGLTRRQIVLQRVVLGCVLIVALGAWMWLLVSLGFRERVHRFLRWEDVIYYPMSTGYETSIARPFVLCALASFGLMIFYMTWRGLCQAAWNGTSSGMFRLIVLEAPVGIVMLYLMMFSGGAMILSGDMEDYGSFVEWLVWLPLCLSGLGVGVAWVAARNLEAV